MDVDRDRVRPRRDGGATRWGVHVLIYALLGGLFMYVLMARYYRPLVWREGIGAEPADVELVEQRLDPNTATWAELARLPEIGEITAKKIVAYRDARRAESGGTDAVVFAAPEDLEGVNGIGPKTAAKVAHYLKFSDTEGPSALPR